MTEKLFRFRQSTSHWMSMLASHGKGKQLISRRNVWHFSVTVTLLMSHRKKQHKHNHDSMMMGYGAHTLYDIVLVFTNVESENHQLILKLKCSNLSTNDLPSLVFATCGQTASTNVEYKHNYWTWMSRPRLFHLAHYFIHVLKLFPTPGQGNDLLCVLLLQPHCRARPTWRHHQLAAQRHHEY